VLDGGVELVVGDGQDEGVDLQGAQPGAEPVPPRPRITAAASALPEGHVPAAGQHLCGARAGRHRYQFPGLPVSLVTPIMPPGSPNIAARSGPAPRRQH